MIFYAKYSKSDIQTFIGLFSVEYCFGLLMMKIYFSAVKLFVFAAASLVSQLAGRR